MIKNNIHVSRKNMNCIAVQLISGSYSQRRILDDAFKKSVGLSEIEFKQNLNALQALGAITIDKDASGRDVISICPPLFTVNLFYKEKLLEFWLPTGISVLAVIISVVAFVFSQFNIMT